MGGRGAKSKCERVAAVAETTDVNAEQKDLIGKLVANPTLLSNYTPETLKTALEQEGYETKPLSKGRLRRISFEQGGGYKVNFSNNGLLQYHPARHSHHDGAYYKISTNEGGVHRYGLDGIEQKERS